MALRRHLILLIQRALGSSWVKRLYFNSKKASVQFVYPHWPYFHDLLFVKLKSKIRKLYFKSIKNQSHTSGDNSSLYSLNRNSSDVSLKVSIIVPNYCHERYLEQRLQSIYGQTYKNFEVILLDDASKDGSVKILEQYAKVYSENTKCCFNVVNSGGVFKQWQRGLEFATGDLVWIAESDDYCSENFLEELVQCFYNEAVMFAYARSVFVGGDGAEEIWSIEEYLSDIDELLWKSPFLMSAHQLVNKAWAIKNVVPNVSSAIFRNPGSMHLLEDQSWQQMRICGDWVFYLHVIRGGLVAYSPQATNYYRIHNTNTSTATYSQDVYYQEHERVAKELVSLYRLDNKVLDCQKNVLKQHWEIYKSGSSDADFDRCYDIARVEQWSLRRKPNLLIATLAFVAGGGETFPIKLANLLKSIGYSVCLLNCNYNKTESGVRSMLDRGIPVLELDPLHKFEMAVDDMGIEIIHSHHAWVDATICSLLENNDVKIVVTTHGMYELIDRKELNGLIPMLKRKVSQFVYTADKNLAAFENSGIDVSKFIKIGNALDIFEINAISRFELGIEENAFVICLVSRAVPDKGWQEAIESVLLARESTGCDIHLVLIGEGPEYSRLKASNLPECIHLLGFKSNIRDYFAMSNLGLLPSRFAGESFPLVLIDCLHSNRPFLASNVGEISYMLDSEFGHAGSVFELENGSIPIEKLADLISAYATDKEFYREHLERVSWAVQKFDPYDMVTKYGNIYENLVQSAAENNGTL